MPPAAAAAAAAAVRVAVHITFTASSATRCTQWFDAHEAFEDVLTTLGTAHARGP
jgi:hypothetical protein